MKQTAIVTGAIQGIGLAIARRLGLDGFQVMLTATGPKAQHADTLAADGIPCTMRWCWRKGPSVRRRMSNDFLTKPQNA